MLHIKHLQDPENGFKWAWRSTCNHQVKFECELAWSMQWRQTKFLLSEQRRDGDGHGLKRALWKIDTGAGGRSMIPSHIESISSADMLPDKHANANQACNLL